MLSVEEGASFFSLSADSNSKKRKKTKKNTLEWEDTRARENFREGSVYMCPVLSRARFPRSSKRAGEERKARSGKGGRATNICISRH